MRGGYEGTQHFRTLVVGDRHEFTVTKTQVSLSDELNQVVNEIMPTWKNHELKFWDRLQSLLIWMAARDLTLSNQDIYIYNL